MKRLLLFAALGGLAACSGSTYDINLNQVNNSSETGSVVVTDNGNGALIVAITLANVPANTSQPAHIHNGRCSAFGAINQPLNPVDNPSSAAASIASSTAIAAKWADIKGKTYLDVHRSYQNQDVVVACGNID